MMRYINLRFTYLLTYTHTRHEAC